MGCMVSVWHIQTGYIHSCFCKFPDHFTRACGRTNCTYYLRFPPRIGIHCCLAYSKITRLKRRFDSLKVKNVMTFTIRYIAWQIYPLKGERNNFNKKRQFPTQKVGYPEPHKVSLIDEAYSPAKFCAETLIRVYRKYLLVYSRIFIYRRLLESIHSSSNI